MDRVKVRVEEATGGKQKLEEIGVETLLVQFSGVVFEEVTTLWNWIFENGGAYGDGGKYEPIDTKWLEDNVSIRLIGEVLKELAEQSRMAWIIPFFKSQGQRALRQMQSAASGQARTP